MIMAECKVFLDGGEMRVTCPIGARTHPVTGEADKIHYGADIVSKVWRPQTRLKPLGSGIIINMATTVKGFSDVKGETGGNYLYIKHDNEYKSWLKHLKYGSIPLHLKVGDKIYADTYIGDMGSTGLSTGEHVHVELERIINGKLKCIDPVPYLLGQLKVPGSDEMGGEEMGYPILTENVNTSSPDKSEAVKKLQRVLNEKYGYSLVVDGNFGTKTEAAVKDYQTANGLGVDGRCGPATIASLNRDLYAEIKGLRTEKAELKTEQTKLQTEKSSLQKQLNEKNGAITKAKNALSDILKSI